MQDEQHQRLIQHYTQVLVHNEWAIDHHAVQILKRLKDARFEAYLVGGGVRDLLVNIKPKDFDIATSALPQEVKKKVSNSFIIGRRFKLVHAKRGDAIYEIATYRRAATSEELVTAEEDDLRHVEENFFGNIDEDSFRRDFTINSLYYDPIDKKIVDRCNGLYDIDHRMLRMIGDPEARLREDPIRILRAIRLSQKLGFSIEPELRKQIRLLAPELKKTALPRRREEWIKFLRLPQADMALMELFDLGIMEQILPNLHMLFENHAQREDFLCSIRQISYIGFDLSDTTELYSALLIAFLAQHKTPEVTFETLINNENFILFCRDELGVFKAEIASFVQALQVIRPIQNVEAYMKRGERRKRSFVANMSFFLALKLGFLSGQIDIQELHFWLNEHKTLLGSDLARETTPE